MAVVLKKMLDKNSSMRLTINDTLDLKKFKELKDPIREE